MHMHLVLLCPQVVNPVQIIYELSFLCSYSRFRIICEQSTSSVIFHTMFKLSLSSLHPLWLFTLCSNYLQIVHILCSYPHLVQIICEWSIFSARTHDRFRLSASSWYHLWVLTEYLLLADDVNRVHHMLTNILNKVHHQWNGLFPNPVEFSLWVQFSFFAIANV